MAHHRHHHHHHRRHHGRHHRRNPSGSELLWGVGGAIGGWYVNRSIVNSFAPSGVMNYALQGGVALGGGWALGKWKRPVGQGFMIGAFASLAMRLYGDFVGGSGVSGYVETDSPTLEFDHGNALSLPAWTPGGAPASIPQAGSSGARAVAVKTGTSIPMSSPRFQSRLSLS